MLTDVFILIICSIAAALLGLVIFLRNPSQPTNRRFALLALSLVTWTVANYLSDHATTNVLFYTRLTFFGGVASAYTLVNFIAKFPNSTLFNKSKLLLTEKILAFILLPITFTPLFVSSVVIDSSGQGTINTSIMYYLFLIFILLTLALVIVAIIKQNRNAASYAEKQQIEIVSWGVILYAILAVVSNVILPLIVNSWSSSRFGPAFTLFLIIMVAYTIIKHRLFDIRLIVARSMAYVLALATLAGIFTIITIFITNLIFSNKLNSAETRTVYTIIAIVLAFSFPRLKQFFDQVTNKYFYRDAYDIKSAIDGFSGVLVASIDLELILDETKKLFSKTIRPQFTKFSLTSKHVDLDSGDSEIVGFSEDELRGIQKFITSSKSQVIMVDDMLIEDNHLKNIISEKNISAFIKLSTSDGSVGFIMLGPKLTGSIYNSQDRSFLTIVSKELALAIQNALRFREIQQFNITLQKKIEEATHQLRRANDKLRKLDETKDEFISMASHQLRTPLTTVKGYVSMVLEGDAGKISDPQRKLLDQSFLSAQRMVYLIADLLNVSRLRTGKFVIDSTPTNLADLVEGEIEQLKETAKGRHLELIFNKPKEFPVLMLDDTKIRQVVMNFADNAIYYTPAGGHININLEDKGETVEFTVVDDGIGVPKTVQHNLFSKFYRADNAKKARPDGTGLGLFMAQKVVVAQGGAIIFHSEEGHGSTFGFSFAKSKVKVPDHRKSDVKKAEEHKKEPSLL